jgi:glycosyltransferase involved in cell wall biosynthesis
VNKIKSMSEINGHPTIEVMVPFYGDVSHLMSAVTSVIDQTFQDWKMTIVDDGYPDDSIPNRISDLKDSRVSYIKNDVNLGANANYKKCIQLASSDLVVMMGADDVMLPNYMEVVLAAYRSYPSAAMFHPGVTVINEVGLTTKSLIDSTKKKYAPKSEFIQDLYGEKLAVSLMKGNWTYFPAICWRRDQLVRHSFRNGLNVTQDLALLIDQILAGAHLIHIPTVAFEYRRHTNSDSSLKAVDGQRFIEESRLFNDLADEFQKNGWTSASRASRLHLSSRANALFHLPLALKRMNATGVGRLLAHAFGK